MATDTELIEQEIPEAPFQITMSLDKDFVRAFKRLSKKYGDDILHLNGFAPDQLNFTSFIDNFVDTKTVADVTIDGNANSGTKDIVTMQSDMKKPHTKLLAFNKIFYEMRKKYGLDRANKWLEDEWSGALYLHDAPSSTLVPYSYKGSEIIKVKYKDNLYATSFEQLYDLVEEPEILLNEEHSAYCKYTNDLYVWDNVDNSNCWTRVIRVIRKPRANEFRYIRCSNGLSEIVTDNHPLITKSGDVEAGKAERGLEMISFAPERWAGDIQELYIADYLNKDNLDFYLSGKRSSTVLDMHGEGYISRSTMVYPNGCTRNKVTLDRDFGYIVGLLVTDGTYSSRRLVISQKNSSIRERIFKICEKKGIRYSILSNSTGITVGDSLLHYFVTKAILKKATGEQKCLLPEFINYNKDFILGVIDGMLDGDGTFPKRWKHTACFFSASRTLINQFAFIMSSFGFMVKHQKPRCSETQFNRKIAHPKHHYTVAFNIYKDSTVLKPEKAADLVFDKSIEEVRNSANKRYTYSYDEAYLYENFSLIHDSDEYVYDISTETTHFICNNLLSHNCFAYDLDEVAAKGLFFISRFRTRAPQHLDTFNNHVLEFVSWTSNRQSGAVGLPSYLIYSFYFWKKDVESGNCADPIKYRDQQFQKFIYDLNQPYLRITECAFTNISIFDREYLIGLFGGRQYPDGSFVVDYIEEIIEYQKAFMEMVSKIRSETMMTFPVITCSLLFQNGKFVDEEFARWCNKHNMKWCDSNFFVGNDVTTLSNCCFSGDQELYYYDSEGSKVLTTFKNFVEQRLKVSTYCGTKEVRATNGEYIVDPSTGKLAEISAVARIPNTWKKLVEIELEDGRVFKVTPDQRFYDKNSKRLITAQELLATPEIFDI